MIGAILSAIPSVISLLNADSASDDYKKAVDAVKANQRLSPSMLKAQQVMAENATRGLAGYEGMKEDIYSSLPTTMNQAKDWLSGAGAIDFLAKAKAGQDADLRKLGYANEQARQANEAAYAGFLSGPMASEENRLSSTLTGLDMNAANADVYSSAAHNNIWMTLANNLGQSTTDDLTNLIAGLSGNQNPLPNPTGVAPTAPKSATFGDSPAPAAGYNAIIQDLINRGIFKR